MASPSPGRLFCDQRMERAELLRFAAGEVAVYSTRAPVAEDRLNEDAAAIVPCGDRSGILVVADGVGGARSGAAASRAAVEALRQAVTDGPELQTNLRAAVLNGIEQANASVAALGSGAATTLAVVAVEDGTVRPFHVGDSTILVLGQRGRIKHQSVAHGPVGYAIEAGLLDHTEALHHEELHVVSNIVGSSQMRIEIGPSIELARRDTVLVASDGLSDNLYVDEIVERVRRGALAAAAERLAADCRLRMARDASGSHPSKPDDLTFLLYRPASVPAARRRGATPTRNG